MAAEPEILPFDPDEPGDVAAVLGELALAGTGWVNVYPGLDPTLFPDERGGWLGIFTNRGPGLPQATWVAAKSPDRPTVGLRHGLGTTVRQHLADHGVAIPETWRRLGDHPKRGLVLSVPSRERAATVVGWMVAALGAVTPLEPDRAWVSEIYR